MRPDLDNQRSNSAVFDGVEELEEAAQALGWHIDYRAHFGESPSETLAR